MFSLPIVNYISSGNYMGAFAYIAGCFVIVFLVLPFHEYAHGFVANRLGDPTARYAGRLSFNPMRHIDWLGACLILLVGFGWAKPVPVNARYFQHPKRDMAITALAGPVSNLLMALVALLLCNGTIEVALATGGWVQLGESYYVTEQIGAGVFTFIVGFLNAVATINVGLAVFNLIPIPPLDGSRLLTALLPDRMYYKIMQYEQFIMLGLFALIFIGVLDGPLYFLRTYVFNGLEWLASLPFGLF